MKKLLLPLLLGLAGLAGGIAFLVLRMDLPLLARIGLKVVPSLAIAAWMLVKGIDRSNWPILAGLLGSMTCDIFMELPQDPWMVGGIAANLAALVLYTLYFWRSDTSPDLERLLPIVVVMGVFYFVIHDFIASNAIAVLVYTAVYVVFMWRATARLGDPDLPVLSQQACFLGALFLLVSDCLLSFILFGILPDQAKYYWVVMALWWGGLWLLMVTAETKRQAGRMAGTGG